MSNAQYEGRHPGEFILSEEEGNYARDVGTLASGQNLEAGTVLETSNSKYVIYAGGTATGILYADTDATDGDVDCVVMVRGPLEVIGDALVYASGTSEGDITGAITDLAALGIVVRGTGE